MKDDEENLFREAVKNVKPLKIKSKTIEIIGNKPKPIAKKFLEDERVVRKDFLKVLISGLGPIIPKQIA